MKSALRFSTVAVRLWRFGALCWLGFLLHKTAPQGGSGWNVEGAFLLEDARAFFVGADVLDPQKDGTCLVLSNQGGQREVLGSLARTSPQGERVIGYSGPSDLMVALDPKGKVCGVRMIRSGDTKAHVEALREKAGFWNQLRGWRPASEAPPVIEAVGGSTLTSLAVVEAIHARFSGERLSLRFPEPLTVSEVGVLFPEASTLLPKKGKSGWWEARDPQGTLRGYVLRTSPESDAVSGYAGPTESLIGLAPDGKTITGVTLRKSYDTEEYVDRVRGDPGYLRLLTRWKIDEWPDVNFAKEGVEGVSGATLTSYAVAEGIKRRLREEKETRTKDDGGAVLGWFKKWGVGIREWALWGILCGAAIMSFSRFRGDRWVRKGWQFILIAGLGLWLGHFVSIGLLCGWARAGVNGPKSVGILSLVAFAILVPWATRRQVYCHQLCPHGALQGWLGRFERLHFRISKPWQRLLEVIPALTLAAGILCFLLFPHLDLAQLEPFDAWVLGGGAAVAAVIAVLGLLGSLFVPNAYCHYGCPTGALLRFVRSSSTSETFGSKDRWAGVILILATLVTYVPTGFRVWMPPESKSEGRSLSQGGALEFRGSSFGTSWCIKVRGTIEDEAGFRKEVDTELERIESTLSPWRGDSVTSLFNDSETTFALEIPEELGRIVSFAQGLSELSGGAYDITVAPFVSAWGFGPEGTRDRDPEAAELEVLKDSVGWQKLHVAPDYRSVRKTHPKLRIILSLLQGYAVDRVSEVLERRGCREFLVELGGEMRASGSWEVGIEDPRNPHQLIRTLILTDASLATSGLYRTRRTQRGREVSHIVSPRTGYPLVTEVDLCSVVAATCLEAKGHVSALICQEFSEARSLAERENWRVLWITRSGEISHLGEWDFSRRVGK